MGAIPNVRAFNPEARIIAMFRSPVEMVYSLHFQLLYSSEQIVADFETACRGRDLRRR